MTNRVTLTHAAIALEFFASFIHSRQVCANIYSIPAAAGDERRYILYTYIRMRVYSIVQIYLIMCFIPANARVLFDAINLFCKRRDAHFKWFLFAANCFPLKYAKECSLWRETLNVFLNVLVSARVAAARFKGTHTKQA